MTTSAANQPGFGICVTLSESDPFVRLLDPDWQATHWYPTAIERNHALSDMQREHEYSRRGDKPSLIFTAIENSSTA
jgi:hypothetical protein